MSEIKLSNGIITSLEKISVSADKVLIRFRNDEFDNALMNYSVNGVKIMVRDDCDNGLDRRSLVFRQLADVLKVGESVTGIESGDKAIVDYKIDNDIYIVIGEDKQGKLCVINGMTTYIKENGQILPEKTADFYGVIRDEKYLAKEPFVIIEYKDEYENIVTETGLVFDKHLKNNEYRVISASNVSKNKFFIFEGAEVHINNEDVFNLRINEKEIMYCYDLSINLCSKVRGKKLNELINLIEQ
mgnify:CR=1 FL=1